METQVYAAIDVGGTKIAGALVEYCCEAGRPDRPEEFGGAQSLKQSCFGESATGTFASCGTRLVSTPEPLGGAKGGAEGPSGAIASPNAVEPPGVAYRCSVPTGAAEGGAAVLERVVAVAKELQAQAEVPLAGIGVGAAGVIDPRTGNVRYANDIMSGWSGQPLRSRLAEEFGVPVSTLGDVQAHALGEARWGAARGAQSCLVVGIGTGLGGAYVLDGNVLRGFRGAAGHFGHTLHPRAAGVACACGHDAHVETVTSGVAISAAYQGRAFGDELDPQLMGDTVSKRANEGDFEAMAVIDAAGRALGEAIGSWCNMFDPELVVLSGTVTQAGHVWRRALDEGFKTQILSPLADIPIVYAALGGDAPLIGAAEAVRDRSSY